jgi:hypothetical protein
MAQKPKARSAKKKTKPKKKTPNEAQFERFIETVREFGADITDEDFERTVEKIGISARLKKRTK